MTNCLPLFLISFFFTLKVICYYVRIRIEPTPSAASIATSAAHRFHHQKRLVHGIGLGIISKSGKGVAFALGRIWHSLDQLHYLYLEKSQGINMR